MDFPARSKADDEMLEWLRHQFGENGKSSRISVERIVSGKGIVNIYKYLAHKHPEQVGVRGEWVGWREEWKTGGRRAMMPLVCVPDRHQLNP